MSIRNKLAEREEQRSKAGQGGGLNDGLPEGVTRYVRAAEVKDGKTFAILADPDKWFFYYTHEDGDYASRSQYFRKHTCLNSPREVGANFDSYAKPNGTVCLSCKAKAKRKLYFFIPVFDFAYATWRILDMKEYHASNLIGDYDKLEKAAKKFDKAYSLVGDTVSIGRTSDGKSFSLESAETDGLEALIEEAKKFVGFAFPYEELANFRDEEDIRKLLEEADASHIDTSALGERAAATPLAKSTQTDAEGAGGAAEPSLNF